MAAGSVFLDADRCRLLFTPRDTLLSGEKKSLLAQRNERGWRRHRGGQGAGEARKRHREIERRENEGVVGEGSNETNEGEIEREMETRGRSETRLSVLFVESGDETRGRK